MIKIICDLRFKRILFASKYLVKKYGEVEAIRRAVARKSVKKSRDALKKDKYGMYINAPGYNEIKID